MNTSTRSTVLVSGGTGQQGGATVRQLLQAGRVNVRVLTRDLTSQRARQLATQGVELALGDFDDPTALAKALTGVTAAFSVQGFMDKGVALEVQRGRAMADAVKAAGGVHLVYSSVDGAERSSGVPHFDSKWQVETHIRRLGLPATILRPVAFMENMQAPGFPRAMFLGLLRAAMGVEKRLQLVSIADIGWFAARALESPERHVGRTIAVAADALGVRELLTVWQRQTGRAPWLMPLPRFFPRLLPKDFSTMLAWFRTSGYTVDIDAVRREHPGLQDFSAWVAEQDKLDRELEPGRGG